ncbi:uncharacterized protein LOC119667833 [Teleopsis dalmanni]|nr:uncharacterized protein LOC119667833 [Teleopsis dalmanni]
MDRNIVIILFCFGFSMMLLDSVCNAYSGLIPADPDNPGKCIHHGDTLKLGINPGNAPCQRLTCNEDGSILIEG